jgi:hypothetical protein
MIISLQKIEKSWTFLIKKSHAGRVLQEFKLSKEILLRIALDVVMNMNNGRGYFMNLTTNEGPYVLRVAKVLPTADSGNNEDELKEIISPTETEVKQEENVSPKEAAINKMEDVVLDGIDWENSGLPP